MLCAVLALAFPPSIGHWTYLDTADLSKIRQSHGRPRRNASVYGTPLKVGGKTFERGVGTHANSIWILSTDGKATQFYAEVGVQDSEPDGSAVVFKVIADERALFVSPAKKAGDPPTTVRVDVQGVKRLKLEVQGAGDGSKPAAATWGAAQLEMLTSTDEPTSEAAYAFPPARDFPPVAPEPLAFPLKFIVCADEDGTNDRGFKPDAVPTIVRHLNASFRQAGISFTFDPVDFEVRRDSTLNRDFDPSQVEYVDPDKKPAETNRGRHYSARSALAREFPGKIVVVMRRGSVWEWDETGKKWNDRPSSENYSDGRIVSPARSEDLGMFSHEIGHYFGLAHTFGPRPKSIEEVRDVLRAEVARGVAKDRADQVFDGDGIPDTPPDPGTTALEAMGYELFVPYAGGEVAVDFPDSSQRAYLLNPDVFDTMSYYFDCRLQHPMTKTVCGGFTWGQCLMMRTNAENRKAALTDPTSKPKILALAEWPYADSRPIVQIRASDTGWGRLRAIADGQAAPAKGDFRRAAFGWGARSGSSEWIEYEFRDPVSATDCSVHWVTEADEKTRLSAPRAWRLSTWSGSGWTPVTPTGLPNPERAVARSSFVKVTSRRFRLDVESEPESRSALFEWVVR